MKTLLENLTVNGIISEEIHEICIGRESTHSVPE